MERKNTHFTKQCFWCHQQDRDFFYCHWSYEKNSIDDVFSIPKFVWNHEEEKPRKFVICRKCVPTFTGILRNQRFWSKFEKAGFGLLIFFFVSMGIATLILFLLAGLESIDLISREPIITFVYILIIWAMIGAPAILEMLLFWLWRRANYLVLGEEDDFESYQERTRRPSGDAKVLGYITGSLVFLILLAVLIPLFVIVSEGRSFMSMSDIQFSEAYDASFRAIVPPYLMIMISLIAIYSVTRWFTRKLHEEAMIQKLIAEKRIEPIE